MTDRIVPNLLTPDPRGSVTFYRDLLGLDVVMDQGWIVTLAAPGHPSAQLSLVSGDATAPLAPAVSVGVADVAAAHAAAVRAGHEIVHPLTDEPWGVRRFFVRDPAGHVINVVSHG